MTVFMDGRFTPLAVKYMSMAPVQAAAVFPMARLQVGQLIQLSGVSAGRRPVHCFEDTLELLASSHGSIHKTFLLWRVCINQRRRARSAGRNQREDGETTGGVLRQSQSKQFGDARSSS